MNSCAEGKQHLINLNMRSKMDISGVSEVVSFDDMGAILKTSCGELTIEGKDIKMSVLDTDKGVVVLEGHVDALFYSQKDEEKKSGLFGRLIR